MSGAAKLKIFIAEDDTAILELVRIRLELSGHHTFYARDGHRAVEAIPKVLPDAVLLDIGLPGLDGFEVLRAIRTNGRCEHVPVLMLTARHTAGDVQKSLLLGAQDFMTKPFDQWKLSSRVERMIANHKSKTGAPTSAIFV